MADVIMNGENNRMRSRQPSQDEGSRLLGEPAEDGFCERIKPKVSLCLGTTAVLSFMVFLFLVPFVVDPAVSRLIARYSSDPGTCVLHEHVFSAGLSKCTWSSCREGCTSATTKCHQITNYLTPESLEWAGTLVRFLVNTEGCGYPPFINCSVFARKYGYNGTAEFYATFETTSQPMTVELYRYGQASSTFSMFDPTALVATDATGDEMTTTTAVDLSGRQQQLQQGADKVFPCYYSQAYPDRVVAEYDWHHTVKTLVAAVVIPWTLFIVSCAVLCYWYCPTLKKEFMIDRKRTVAAKNDNSQMVIRRKLSKRPFSTDEEDGDY